MSSWIERDRAVLWHPFTQHEEWFSYDPLVIERAEGFDLIDTEGRRYLDGVSSIWCNVPLLGSRCARTRCCSTPACPRNSRTSRSVCATAVIQSRST